MSPEVERLLAKAMIYTTVGESRVEVLAIKHHKRRPGYWHGR